MSEIKLVPGSLSVTQSQSVDFNVDLGLGLTGTCTVWSNANEIPGASGRYWIEIVDSEWEFSIAGKTAKYLGVKELYEKVFGETSFVNMLRKYEDLCEAEVNKGEVLNLLTPDTLSLEELERIMEKYIVDHPKVVGTYNDMLYTSDFTIRHLAKIYNEKQPYDYLKIDVFKTKNLPPTFRLNSPNPELLRRWEDNPNVHEIEVVALSKLPKGQGKKVSPFRA